MRGAEKVRESRKGQRNPEKDFLTEGQSVAKQKQRPGSAKSKWQMRSLLFSMCCARCLIYSSLQDVELVFNKLTAAWLR